MSSMKLREIESTKIVCARKFFDEIGWRVSEDRVKWLPLGHHGQGLQSLAVIFLFQAAVLQQLAEAERPGVEAVFVIEEPEAHLHPQAARTLWERVQTLSGQKLMTTHSPYFVQHVPLRDLRLVKLRGGCTEVAAIPHQLVSELPWTTAHDGLVKGALAAKVFAQDATTGYVSAVSWFDDKLRAALAKCYKNDADATAKAEATARFRNACRILPSVEDEEELSFHGRRVRGEIFFARRWILVEGVTEYLLIHALGRALGWPLDAHGVSVIDFQQSGSAGIYPALASALGIPWHMLVDGDSASARFRQQLVDRGFQEADIAGRFITLPDQHDLEDQLLADGHEQMLREMIAATGVKTALTCSPDEFAKQLKSRKTAYMSALALRVVNDGALAAKMPKPFVDLVTGLRDGTI